MSTTMKRAINSALSHKLSFKTISLLVAIVIGTLFIPYFQSLARWAANRNVAFEDGSIALPTRWTSEGEGHLLSIRRSGATFLFPFESTITIDPFSERWPADKIGAISDHWMRGHGSPVFNGRFKDRITGTDVAFPSEIKCVSPAEDAKAKYVRIYCLSADFVHSFEFFGQPDAIAAFAQVSSDATQIIRRHPGSVFRK
jgi:hypothetical protein